MEVRGTALRSALVACDEVFGVGSADRVLAALSPEHRAILAGTILSTGWYPVHVQAALHEALRSTLGKGSLEANKRVGYQAARADFRGVYRIFLPMLTWDLLFTSIDRAWLRYNSRGKVSFSNQTERSAIGRVEDVEGYTDPMWSSICGRTTALIELSGGTHVRAHITESRPTCCSIAFHWQR